MPVDEQVCDLKMAALTEKLELMLKPINDGIKRIEGQFGSFAEAAKSYVLKSDFEAKCREIEDLKKFCWRVSGGLSLAAFLAGLIIKFIK